METNKKALCRNCQCELSIGQEVYVDGFDAKGDNLYHCIDCHDLLYSSQRWYDLSVDGFDEETEQEIISDNYYFTTLEE